MEDLVKNEQLSINRFFNGKRVLITGHTGFKGAWLSILLRELGAEVLGYSLEPPTEPSLFKSTKLDELIRSDIGDIREYGRLKRSFQEFEPEIVFHLAAQSLVLESYRSPVETYATNVTGTVNVLEACRLSDSVRCAVIVTSDKCYENRNWMWGYRENDRLGGKDPYSNSKACAELVVAGYQASFFTEVKKTKGVATARAGNVIGGGDWAKDRIIPDCIKAFENGNPVLLRNPNAIRPWQHVLEPLHGYLLLAQALYHKPAEHVGAWNFGPGPQSCVCVHEIVDRAIAVWGMGQWLSASSSAPFSEAGLLRIDSSKAQTRLSWQPKWDYAMAVSQTIQWHRKHHSGEDMYAVCTEQLSEYWETGSNSDRS
jgi:CDP-glucose 4,6-dehydratase